MSKDIFVGGRIILGDVLCSSSRFIFTNVEDGRNVSGCADIRLCIDRYSKIRVLRTVLYSERDIHKQVLVEEIVQLVE